jgi:protocatechuate 3,4-dioxygenase, beta subunit
MKKITIVIISVLCFYLPHGIMAQSHQLASTDRNSVGGGCEGCDLMFVEIPSTIKSDVMIVNPAEPGEKLEISGVIYKSDGKTPASNVILYVYQTAKSGLYEPGHNQTGGVRRHGRIRGWVKTNLKGEYKFLSIRPGNYPDGENAAHIHPTIKEPDKNEYHIDEFVFDDDKFVDAEFRSREQLRGGSGILHLKKENGKWIGHRDIVLGLNIPNYPK